MQKIPNLKSSSISRRDFIKTSAVGATTVLAGKNVIFAASAGRKLRIGLIGCGGRGNGALQNCLDAGEHIENLELEVVATADWFKNKAEATGKNIMFRHQDALTAPMLIRTCSIQTLMLC